MSNEIPIVVGIAVIVGAATVIHELGHAVAAWSLGIPVRWILIGNGPVFWRRPLGHGIELVLRVLPTGVAVGILDRRDANGIPSRPIGHDMLVAAAGPLASLLLAAALWSVGQIELIPLWLRYWLMGGGLLSLAIGVISLVPVPGLDGGHLLLLGLTRAGLQLSPERELQIHRLGVNFVLVGSLTSLAISLVHLL